jgi:hypothetical protein
MEAGGESRVRDGRERERERCPHARRSVTLFRRQRRRAAALEASAKHAPDTKTPFSLRAALPWPPARVSSRFPPSAPPPSLDTIFLLACMIPCVWLRVAHASTWPLHFGEACALPPDLQSRSIALSRTSSHHRTFTWLTCTAWHIGLLDKIVFFIKFKVLGRSMLQSSILFTSQDQP